MQEINTNLKKQLFDYFSQISNILTEVAL